MDKRPGTVVGRIVAFVAFTEYRRLPVVVGIPLLFVVLFEHTANFGVLILLLATSLATITGTLPMTGRAWASISFKKYGGPGVDYQCLRE